MRDPRFLHVSVAVSTWVDPAIIDHVIDAESYDWFRFSWYTYIVWTSSDCETICRKILRIPGLEASHVFVCALNTEDGFGQLSTVAWEWIKRDRGYGSVQTWMPPDIVQPGDPKLPG